MGVDWELLERRTIPSPLLSVLGTGGEGGRKGNADARSNTWFNAVNAPNAYQGKPKKGANGKKGLGSGKWTIDDKAAQLADQLASSQADQELVDSMANDYASTRNSAQSTRSTQRSAGSDRMTELVRHRPPPPATRCRHPPPAAARCRRPLPASGAQPRASEPASLMPKWPCLRSRRRAARC